ncbi:MAG: LptA/OstA family protein [Pseudomonadota bacterium]
MMRYFASAVAAIACTSAAAAQLSAEGGPIQIDSDSAQVLESQRRIIYIGNVDVTQGDARLQTDRLIVNSKPPVGGGEGLSGFGPLDTIEAIGDVFYVTTEFKARGDRALYRRDSDTISLTNNVVLLRGEDVAVGETLTLRVSEGVSTLDGEEGGRVRMTIQSQQPTSP